MTGLLQPPPLNIRDHSSVLHGDYPEIPRLPPPDNRTALFSPHTSFPPPAYLSLHWPTHYDVLPPRHGEPLLTLRLRRRKARRARRRPSGPGSPIIVATHARPFLPRSEMVEARDLEEGVCRVG